MGKRIFSTFALWAIILGLLYFGGAQGAVWLMAVIVSLTLWEFYGLMQHMGYAPFHKLAVAVGALMVLVGYYAPKYGWPIDGSDVLAAGVVAFSIRILREREPQARVESLAISLFGLTYVALMLSYFVPIISWPGPSEATGLVFFLWVIAVSKFCDVGALLSGMAFGKHKMAPVISPKKTWEGAAGGLLVSMGVGALIAHFTRAWTPADFTPLVAALIALPIAVVGIVADLVESIIKRRAAIKDSGATIPGIGGMFDVTDSLILTAPVGFALLKLAL